MPRTKDNLKPESLAWALTHVRRFGDTDLFPVPFEYESIAHDWKSISSHLDALDLGEYRMRSDRRSLVVKPGGGFRAAIQLDPLDHLMYTAAVYESADLIEQARVPAGQKIACSYRVRLTPSGAFFSPDTGWRDFHERSKELAATRTFSHVLTADISDFYNQLSQHRVQNSLEMASVSSLRSTNLEHFLNQSAAKQSRGLPVGPFASIVLAEACLMDVDNFLLRKGVSHTRYVDDFHIFCKSRKQAIEVRHGLSDYLFTVHRLGLESSKTQVQHINRFIASLSDPEEQERQARLDRINELFTQITEEHGPYWFENETLDEDELMTQAEQESFLELFRQCLTKRPLSLGLARYLLRKALRSRTPILHDVLLENLEAAVPVLRDVVRYLAVTIPDDQKQLRGDQILRFCRRSDLGGIPFVQMWILELMFKCPGLVNQKDALEYAEECSKDLGLRPVALIASVYKQVDWVRSRKETWRNNEPWDRRALIWSASVLPKGERKPFLTMVVEQGDVLDATVAKHLQSK